MARQRLHIVCGNCGNIEAGTTGDNIENFDLSIAKENDGESDFYKAELACNNCGTIHFLSHYIGEGKNTTET